MGNGYPKAYLGYKGGFLRFLKGMNKNIIMVSFYMLKTNQETKLNFLNESKYVEELFMKLSEMNPIFLKHLLLFNCETVKFDAVNTQDTIHCELSKDH